MVMKSEVLPETNLVLTRAGGHLSAQDLRTHHVELVRDPRFHPSLHQLCDLTAVDSVKVSSRALRQLAALNPFGADSRRAIVVEPGDRLVFGLSRVYQGYAVDDSDRIAVQFDHVDEALAWLGADPSVLEHLPAARTAPHTCTTGPIKEEQPHHER